MNIDFKKAGSFSTGCNYWASHAGTNMWKDWRPEMLAKDFKQLANEAGLQILRVFPLWPDFQPLNCLKGGGKKEMRMGENPLGHDELGQAGISPIMMERFAVLADKAEENGLKLIVSLITGWMSGRLYVPPAFENLNVIADPFPLMWEIKFVKAFVRHFKKHKAIVAWEFGNECNCMGAIEKRETAYLWAASISGAIRSADPSRPIISGMHGIQVFAENGNWLIEDQSDTTEILTTHPYPLFTPHCNQDPINTIRNGLHATAESRLYGDIGGKPCMVEEIGTLGPMICSDAVSAEYAKMSMMSSYANDCRSFIWWCAYDQDHLTHAPYDWYAVERELGIFRKDRTKKPLAGAFREFGNFLKKVPKLPAMEKEAVCILTESQDNWGAAYATYILAKQAGFDIEFQDSNQPLKKSSLYLLPSLCGGSSMKRRKWEELLGKVKEGAHLYISCNDALLSPFGKMTGLEVSTREKRSAPFRYSFEFAKDIEFVGSDAKFKLNLKTSGAKVLGREADGNPCFAVNKLGKGMVYFLSIPIETSLSSTPGAFHQNGALPYWKVYEHFAKPFTSGRILKKDDPFIAVTEHPEGKNAKIIFLINYSPEERQTAIGLKSPWKVKQVLYGNLSTGKNGMTKVPANDALVFKAVK